MTRESQRFTALARTVERRRKLSVASVALAAVLILTALLAYTVMPNGLWIHRLLAATLCIGLGIGLLRWLHPRKPSTAQDYALHLDAVFPQLEDSTSLLLRADDESALAGLQRRKVQARLFELERSGQVANSIPAFPWRTVGGAWVVAAVALTLAYPLPPDNSTAPETPLNVTRITQSSVSLEPPAYVGVPPTTTEAMAFSTYEDAQVTWQLSLNQNADEVQLVFHDDDILKLEPQTSRRWISPAWRARSSVYRVVVDNADIEDGVFRIDAKPDQLPRLAVSAPTQNVRELAPGPHESLTMPLNFEASDDYGLTDTRARITLARGNGEQVRFREEAVEVAPQWSGDRKTARVAHELDLIAIGMEPGDELYVYAEASDNRTPAANIGTSDTFIVRWPGANDVAVAPEATLAVPVLPEFFRSQRQIIIDTERLIQQREELDDSTFNQEAQSLAVDQKLLRLRYGQYLGEEDDSGIGAATLISLEEDHDEHGEESGKEHDREDHHDHSAHADEPPQTETPAIGDAQAAIELNAHMHDREEQATLFEPKTRELLRNALSQMWDAELKLRLAQPEAALPFEYAALTFLKEVQQSDRVYARRTGFRPTPIDEERRLTGEIDDIDSRQTDNDPRLTSENSRLRGLLRRLSLAETPTSQQLLDTASVIRTRSLHNPSWLPALGAIERLQRDLGCNACSNELSRELWRQLDDTVPSPATSKNETHPVQRAYDERLSRSAAGGSR